MNLLSYENSTEHSWRTIMSGAKFRQMSLRAIATRDDEQEGEKWQKQKEKNSLSNPGSKLG
jgi:hypothetical protein